MTAIILMEFNDKLRPYCEEFIQLTSHNILFIRILNKLTPEKFEKLSDELLHVGIETKFILKGIILLVSNLSSMMLKRAKISIYTPFCSSVS